MRRLATFELQQNLCGKRIVYGDYSGKSPGGPQIPRLFLRSL